ncbi:MAG: nucleoside-triphosphatase [Elusimicrobiota bacterium]
MEDKIDDRKLTKNLFITGTPGVGKTMLLREVCLPYMPRLGGFYTETVMDGNTREGFILKTLCGKYNGILAKKGMKAKHKLNKYGIDLTVLDNIGVIAVDNAVATRDLVVIDEIGTIEILSPRFCECVARALASKKKVLATIRMNAQPFSDEIKRMYDSEVVEVTRQNYLEVKKYVKEWLGKVLT